jgi:hypothetical protein
MRSKTTGQPTDDRGQPITLHAHDLPRKAPKHLRKLASNTEPSFSGDLHWTEVASLVLVMMVQLGVVYTLQQWMQRTGWSPLNQSILIGTLMGVSIAVFYRIPFVARSLGRQRARRAIDAWAQAGLCPACGHDLALDLHKGDAKPDDDGIAACPQCHAQWQAARFNAAVEAHAGDWRRQWEESQQAQADPAG